MSVHMLQISRPFCPTQISRQLHFSASWRDLSRPENMSSTCCLKQCQFSLRLSPSQCIWGHSMLLRAIVLLFLLLLLTPCKDSESYHKLCTFTLFMQQYCRMENQRELRKASWPKHWKYKYRKCQQLKLLWGHFIRQVHISFN